MWLFLNDSCFNNISSLLSLITSLSLIILSIHYIIPKNGLMIWCSLDSYCLISCDYGILTKNGFASQLSVVQHFMVRVRLAYNPQYWRISKTVNNISGTFLAGNSWYIKYRNHSEFLKRQFVKMQPRMVNCELLIAVISLHGQRG